MAKLAPKPWTTIEVTMTTEAMRHTASMSANSAAFCAYAM